MAWYIVYVAWNDKLGVVEILQYEVVGSAVRQNRAIKDRTPNVIRLILNCEEGY